MIVRAAGLAAALAALALGAAAAQPAPPPATEAAAPAAAEPDPEAAYEVLETGARIFPARRVSGFEPVDDDSILLRAGYNRLYLADISENCVRDLRLRRSIAMIITEPSFRDQDVLMIDGFPCPVRNLRRVALKPAPPAPQAEPEG